VGELEGEAALVAPGGEGKLDGGFFESKAEERRRPPSEKLFLSSTAPETF